MTLKKEGPLNIIITGVGGQGNVVASQIFASAAVRDGFYVSVGETYGASQRGGAVMSHVRLSEETQYGPLTPEGRSHIILGFEPVESLRTIGSFGNVKTKVIVNPRPVYPIDVLSGASKYPSVEEVLKAIKELVHSVHVVEATELAKKAGDPIMQNVVMVGCLAGSGFTPVKVETLREVIREIFAKRRPEANSKAFELGLKEIKRTKPL
ncbi:MAG: indolepyruvate oxidoreductase subunit beta [Candidatus Bathyarchaeota archaeon]|nr:indolepyruvate oxidoreductase subunit beta [Candidatus Bathyarchaeota archaeon]